jgi:hypothetical protein
VTLRFIDWIWHVRGSLALAPGQSGDDAFDRLDPLFRQTGTSHERADGTLTFRKKNQAAQDKMSIFDGGVLRIEQGTAGPVLRYHLTSRALLFCFLAPLLFLGFAQLTIAVGTYEKAAAQAAGKSGKEAEAAKKKKAEQEKKDKEKAERPMNPIDAFLGAPAPEKPKTDDKDKTGKGKGGKDGKGKEDEDKGKKAPSPTPAYVFAGIFATLYLVGRILEDRLIRSLFRKRLAG